MLARELFERFCKPKAVPKLDAATFYGQALGAITQSASERVFSTSQFIVLVAEKRRERCVRFVILYLFILSIWLISQIFETI